MEGPSLRDVILVVEDTALNGSYMEEEITGNYLLPCLEYLSTAVPRKTGATFLNCSSYHMISFGAADRKPRSSTRLQGPFISYKRLLESMERLSWSGGEGETHSSGVEAIGAALRVFDRLDDKRGGRRTSGNT
ncbi:Uncharacterized protein FKW44_023751 [Caligus rogercresseyi]|uniref:Mediator of RNA polymerase II transcription subunit 25 von Willebrand factor type A domain-containing protein n=1 Tax=Caligus rogercresseyi TaxID=217165 RepID=A0A7T8GPI1_CALRO|nr:Uncharacterized protein FKW44_023751 [Caligus rogercresseyi]